MTENRKLLEPLLGVVSVALRVLVGLVVVGFVLSLFVDGIHFGWAGDHACVTADGMSGRSRGTDVMFGAREGVNVTSIPKYCTSDASGSQRLLNALQNLPSFALTIGGLLLLNRLLRGAVRDGIYTLQAASRLRVLGWLLLIGSLLVEATQSMARTALLRTLVETDRAWAVGNVWHIPFLPIFAALGLLAFARIVQAGVAMREDIEGTV
ncbi:hypothetical protein ACFY3G_19140 [Streptomyces phaeochromogenes]|uniref:hypothetical protein n=1 Tax=Streptomyces phaeochromogenes TaxID=1923 RepID=UPI0036917D2E